jgi:hypothetical protein
LARWRKRERRAWAAEEGETEEEEEEEEEEGRTRAALMSDCSWLKDRWLEAACVCVGGGTGACV